MLELTHVSPDQMPGWIYLLEDSVRDETKEQLQRLIFWSETLQIVSAWHQQQRLAGVPWSLDLRHLCCTRDMSQEALTAALNLHSVKPENGCARTRPHQTCHCMLLSRSQA